jgi:hypothetical protein
VHCAAGEGICYGARRRRPDMRRRSEGLNTRGDEAHIGQRIELSGRSLQIGWMQSIFCIQNEDVGRSGEPDAKIVGGADARVRRVNDTRAGTLEPRQDLAGVQIRRSAIDDHDFAGSSGLIGNAAEGLPDGSAFVPTGHHDGDVSHRRRCVFLRDEPHRRSR